MSVTNSLPGIDCVRLSKSVQPPDTTADLEKVSVNSASPNLDRTPGMVDGKVERFSDIGEMITQCERIEQDDNEWTVEEGMRMGGRKLSKRMSELLGIFGEGEMDREVGPNSGGTVSEDNLSSFSSISSLSSVKDNILLSSRKTKTGSNRNIERVGSKLLFWVG